MGVGTEMLLLCNKKSLDLVLLLLLPYFRFGLEGQWGWKEALKPENLKFLGVYLPATWTCSESMEQNGAWN